MVAVYLVEYGRTAVGWPAAISFFVDVMTGVPSIVVGLFIYTALVLTLGLERSGFAAAARPDDPDDPGHGAVDRGDAASSCRNELREASYALGVPKWRTILRIVLPTAMAGIITGAMLAVARVGRRDRAAAAHDVPVASRSTATRSPARRRRCRRSSGTRSAARPTRPIDRAWAGALALILIVMVFYLAAKLVARATGVKR